MSSIRLGSQALALNSSPQGAHISQVSLAGASQRWYCQLSRALKWWYDLSSSSPRKLEECFAAEFSPQSNSFYLIEECELIDIEHEHGRIPRIRYGWARQHNESTPNLPPLLNIPEK